MAQVPDAGTVWVSDEQAEALNEWMAHIEDTSGIEPKPGQAIASACNKALEVES